MSYCGFSDCFIQGPHVHSSASTIVDKPSAERIAELEAELARHEQAGAKLILRLRHHDCGATTPEDRLRCHLQAVGACTTCQLVDAKNHVAGLMLRLHRATDALGQIANDPHCVYTNYYGTDPQYNTGVTDGHRCAATKARAALSQLEDGGAEVSK